MYVNGEPESHFGVETEVSPTFCKIKKTLKTRFNEIYLKNVRNVYNTYGFNIDFRMNVNSFHYMLMSLKSAGNDVVRQYRPMVVCPTIVDHSSVISVLLHPLSFEPQSTYPTEVYTVVPNLFGMDINRSVTVCRLFSIYICWHSEKNKRFVPCTMTI